MNHYNPDLSPRLRAEMKGFILGFTLGVACAALTIMAFEALEHDMQQYQEQVIPVLPHNHQEEAR